MKIGAALKVIIPAALLFSPNRTYEKDMTYDIRQDERRHEEWVSSIYYLTEKDLTRNGEG